MRLGYTVAAALTLVQAALGAPLFKTAVMALGVEDAIAVGAYDVVSVGASYAVDHPGVLGPLLSYIPGAQVILGAASLLGGKFAGSTAGGIASKATQGFIEGSAGDNIPLIGWIIRDGKPEKVADEKQ
ncbi:hypothetical protein GGI04_002016 [Coemansia thaxteri]|uniref:Uncharacterized protein n=1 Tax=Coemansia thaxteri TaxID=2663907 RepID=A0A9W8EHC7_9FUNG|nr:hypothetical protein H4R26_004658 [Coemansia thaxteri]KAJ2006043.1 hypothetical protein GGI04_002016 [Coemansia thaxteri]KAJ2466090.1 hypothetical protein GGI02_004488 [Coemansia sp. RSA 2322]